MEWDNIFGGGVIIIFVVSVVHGHFQHMQLDNRPEKQSGLVS